MIPAYVNEIWECYFETASADRKALLSAALFDVSAVGCDEYYIPYLAAEIDVTGVATHEALLDALGALLVSGTAGGIKRALHSVGDIDIQERNDFVFDVDVSAENKEITQALVSTVRNTALRNKNVRSHLGELRLGYLSKLHIAVFAGGAGEASCVAEMIEGYECEAETVARICAGAVGETVAVAVNQVQ